MRAGRSMPGRGMVEAFDRVCFGCEFPVSIDGLTGIGAFISAVFSGVKSSSSLLYSTESGWGEHGSLPRDKTRLPSGRSKYPVCGSLGVSLMVEKF